MKIEKYQKLLPRKRMLESIAKEYKIQDKKILDVGCGEGLMSSFLTETNTVVGIDKEVEIKGLNSASEKGIKTVRYDIENGLPFDNESFDVVLCLDTIEHIRNYDLLLDECRRVLRSGGLFVVSTPNSNSIPQNIICLLGRESDGHISMFSYKKIFDKIGEHYNILKHDGWTGIKLRKHWLYFSPTIMKSLTIYNTFIVARKRDN